ncbi:DUF2851 family protein [Flagellimonas zhangzhouensis]|uniref:DUF2851 domain-containing protein n=1 Tax=Flagellimonas zhangzhouensis TaxID=1073328 RepID=A0A1H2YZY8_9FLAO|nr:DUF2851 family protein [Allomuricauda zhangzhouensis]SDR04229.1 Protein of unknown function [Allomuricauda zhangzhouensis]SDX10740.1 Protein of unknown function [Allomuricauda zhangzhouensis]
MREDLLYFMWKHNKLPTKQLCTGNKESVTIKSPGFQNKLAGPDFFNAQVEINGQLWAGNVEMHLKSSDWYAHHHETDENYNNVILHVVWEDDIAVFRKDGTRIPALEVQHFVSHELLKSYQNLFEKSKVTFINCERDLGGVDNFLFENWLHRLYIERMEEKSKLVFELLEASKNDWEAVLFIMLAKNFGSKVNGSYFLERAKQLDFSIIRKVSNSPQQLEALLFGHFGLLEVECNDTYFIQLKKEYDYLTRKFGLSAPSSKPNFFGLRPHNFPTIRISQLVNIYKGKHQFFAHLMTLKTKEQVFDAFQVEAGTYWEDHFTFGKISKKSKKRISKSFIDLIILNTLVPLRFCYAKHLGNEDHEDLIALMAQVESEQNSIIKNFDKLGHETKNAMESQAKLTLYQSYCAKNKCLQCAVGTQLLNRNI